MISTAAAFRTPRPQSCPNTPQPSSVNSATPRTAGTNRARDRVGQALDAGLGTLGLADEPDDPLQGTLAAEPSRPRPARCRRRCGSPRRRGRRAAWSTGFDSPVSIDSSTPDSPSTTRPSTGTVSPGRTRTRSPRLDLGERDLDLRPLADHPGRLRGEVEQPLDRRAGRALRPGLQVLPQGDQRQDDPGVHERMGVVRVPVQRAGPGCSRRPSRSPGRSGYPCSTTLAGAAPRPPGSMARPGRLAARPPGRTSPSRSPSSGPRPTGRAAGRSPGRPGGRSARRRRSAGSASSSGPLVPLPPERLGPLADDQLGPTSGVARSGDGLGESGLRRPSRGRASRPPARSPG